MKSNKYALSLLLLLSYIFAISQTIYTPKGTSVNVEYRSEMSQQMKDELKALALSQYNNITFVSEASSKYNCHTHAWAGRTDVWMNAPEQAKYWNDKSYIEYPSTASLVTTVSYDSDDHSALKTSTPNYFISKWGSGPCFIHSADNCPYDVSTLTYYSQTRPSFSVTPIICAGSNGGSSLNPMPVGITWSSTSNL